MTGQFAKYLIYAWKHIQDSICLSPYYLEINYRIYPFLYAEYQSNSFWWHVCSWGKMSFLLIKLIKLTKHVLRVLASQRQERVWWGTHGPHMPLHLAEISPFTPQECQSASCGYIWWVPLITVELFGPVNGTQGSFFSILWGNEKIRGLLYWTFKWGIWLS